MVDWSEIDAHICLHSDAFQHPYDSSFTAANVALPVGYGLSTACGSIPHLSVTEGNQRKHLHSIDLQIHIFETTQTIEISFVLSLSCLNLTQFGTKSIVSERQTVLQASDENKSSIQTRSRLLWLAARVLPINHQSIQRAANQSPFVYF